MGGSEHSKNEFAYENNDMNSNDQYKQGPKADFGTDSSKRPKLEGTDGGNVGTDIISPHEGASDDESDESLVLPSNPPPNGKILCIKNIWNKKTNKKKRKRKKREKEKKRRKEKEGIKEKS
jgi:hypothetical protein